jgi:pimeloyl-ACP methyl ester carboxylesterase
MSTLALDGFQMYFDERGDGEPLLLLHGGTGIGDDWMHVFTNGGHGPIFGALAAPLVDAALSHLSDPL